LFSTQHLDPGVVIVAVGPAGDIDLPGGDTYAPQGGDQEGRLLPAAAAGIAVDREGGGGALVLGLVGGLLMAPSVDLQHGLLKRQSTDTGPEGVVKNPAMEGEVLVVHSGGEDVVEKGLFLQRCAPGRGGSEGEGVVDEGEKEVVGVV